MPIPILVLGAGGHFGGRICRRLASEPHIEILVSSRRAAHAEGLVVALRGEFPGARWRPVALDLQAADFETCLAALAPVVVLHTAGPYQDQDYRVARACVACGSHYLDLADARAFVADFGVLHEAARQRGVLLVSGASTLPGVSSAVVDALRGRFAELHGIEIVIAPAHRTRRGRGTMAAVLSYCGKPFTALQVGRPVVRHGWQDLRLWRHPVLGRRLAGACDVPDLTLLPAQVPELRSLSFHAALAAPWETLALWAMAGLGRVGLVRDWRPLLPALAWLGEQSKRIGSATGGMSIRLSGLDPHGQPMALTWWLTAANDHGPEIPCAPALILARKLARGEESRRGAYPCVGLISLAEFDAELGDLDIHWEIRD